MTNKEIYEKILNKKFEKSVFSGYKPDDVDNFFDLVIDYLKQNEIDVKNAIATSESLKKEIEALKKQLTEKNSKIEELNAKINKLKADGYSNISKNKIQEVLKNKGAQ